MPEKNSKYKFGTEIFYEANMSIPTYFQRGVPFTGGETFPLLRGIVKKLPKDEVSLYMYRTTGK